jgi:hypothetical protein
MPARLPDHLRRTAAERAKEWRARNPGKRGGKSGKGGKHQSKFQRGEFVAVDGEGFSEGEECRWKLGADDRLYVGRSHFYALLSASDGSEIYAEHGRLTTKQCLDFLLAITERNPHAIVVAFGASYDVTQILYDLSVEQLQKALSGEGLGARRFVDVELGEHDYRLEVRPRKSLTVMRWPAGAPKYERDKRGGMKMTPCAKATLWDVWGFFQDSFAGVMRKWIPGHPDYQFIARMKGERSIFDRAEIAEIRRYNAAELRCLVAIMDALRLAVQALGLTLNRWDGAGAIAAAILKLHDVKAHKAKCPSDVELAARHAYSGGHIEVVQLGWHDGAVFHYDVNSAYPAEFAELPSLAQGHWVHGTSGEPPAGFTLVRTRWRFREPMPFYPLFYRTDDGGILYPRAGEGWHWFSEWSVAREFVARFGAHEFEVVEWWHFKAANNADKPFGWIRDYYKRRQDIVAEAKRLGVEMGEEKIIKLGLNSLYGKTAQQVGARRNEDGEIQEPPYFQMEWAGAVTAGCRAKLMYAAIENPAAIIGFATDGLFSTQPLSVDAPVAKELGKWEAQTHIGITMVMPGVYWLHDAGSKPKNYSRGFDKKTMSDPEFVIAAWARKRATVDIELTRLIGLGTAAKGGAWYDMRGMFVTSTRALRLDGMNSKRERITFNLLRQPHRALVPTLPRENDSHEISAPFDVAWANEDRDGFDEEREAIDADLA